MTHICIKSPAIDMTCSVRSLSDTPDQTNRGWNQSAAHHWILHPTRIGPGNAVRAIVPLHKLSRQEVLSALRVLFMYSSIKIFKAFKQQIGRDTFFSNTL